MENFLGAPVHELHGRTLWQYPKKKNERFYYSLIKK